MTGTPLQFRPHLLRQRHLGLLVQAMDAVQDTLTRKEVRLAAERFFEQTIDEGDALAELLRERDAYGQFYPWLLWDAQLRAGCLGRRLLRRATSQDRDEAAIVAALEAASPDAFQIRSIEGKQAVLERIADGEILVVHEPVLDAVSAVDDLLVARAICVEAAEGAASGDEPAAPVWLLDAVHVVLPARSRRAMVRAARAARQLTRERRLSSLIAASLRSLQAQHRKSATMRAPDGAPILRASLGFDVTDDEALRAGLDALVMSRTIERADDGGYIVVDGGLGAPGARLDVRPGRLEATTRSVARAERLRRTLPNALPGLRPRLTLVRDLAAMLDELWLEPDSGADLARMTRDWLDETLRGLAERPLSALDGATPQQAMSTTKGRNRVRAMLRQLEPLSAVGGPQCRASIDSFWAKLSAPSAG